MWELLGEILLFVAIAIIVGLCWLAKGLWDGFLERIMQSAFGEWYRGRPWIWRATVSIVGVISLLFLFWCLWGYGILVGIQAHAFGVIEISVLASLVIFGFLILGACWNISEGLALSGLDKRIIKYGFPLIAFCILILLSITIIAFGTVMLFLATIIAGIVIGMTSPLLCSSSHVHVHELKLGS